MTLPKQPIVLLDTTLRDGEMMPGVTFRPHEKVLFAALLDAMGVDVIEVGYPGIFEKDAEAMVAVAEVVQNAVICGLASASEREIAAVAATLTRAERGRIHLFTPVRLQENALAARNAILETIQASVKLARNCCEDVEWSAFDATRSDPDFLCQAIETAIRSGATTINIPDSLGTTTPEAFLQLLETIFNRVPNIEQAIASVHCHDDLGYAIQNSIVALRAGVRQIECSVNGLGARKGNADLSALVNAIQAEPSHCTHINLELLANASEFLHTQLSATPMGNFRR